MQLRAMNVFQFKEGATIRDIYRQINYTVIDPDKKGIGILLNLKTNREEKINAYNNPHYMPVVTQASMF